MGALYAKNNSQYDFLPWKLCFSSDFCNSKPEHTAIAGRVYNEFNCLPVENEEYQRISEARAREALKPKRETKFIPKVTGKMLQKNIGQADRSSFIVSQFCTSQKRSYSNVEQQVPKASKVRAQDNKTARIPRNELLDLIYGCFRRHKYWPFKSLKAELKQPEAYLKQTLEEVAHLVKSGDFAMTWELKPEARESNYADALAYRDAKEELPPTAGYNFDEVSDVEPTASGIGTDIEDDEANTTFENVV